MTTASRPEETETSASAKAPRGEDHDRGLNDVVAVVERVERPTESILRIAVQLTSSADDPNGCGPTSHFASSSVRSTATSLASTRCAPATHRAVR